MVLRERAPVIVELVVAVVAVIATSLLVIATAKPAESTHWNGGHSCILLMPDVPAFDRAPRIAISIPVYPEATAKADALYRKKEFRAAATVIRDLHDDSFEPLAQLYLELNRAYYGGTDPGGQPDEMFESLVEARRVDLALGGAFARELELALVIMTPKAAITYVAKGEDDRARIAVATAVSLGIANNGNIRAVQQHLARQKLTH